jgi:hypothetical protein
MVIRAAELGGTVAPDTFGFLVQKSAVLLALDPDVIPDGRLTVEFPSPSSAFCSGFQQDGPPFTTITYFPETPANGELVELEPAPDLRALLGYTFLGQPAVRRVLLAFSGAGSGSVPVDVRGVRLLGWGCASRPTRRTPAASRRKGSAGAPSSSPARPAWVSGCPDRRDPRVRPARASAHSPAVRPSCRPPAGQGARAALPWYGGRRRADKSTVSTARRGRATAGLLDQPAARESCVVSSCR